MKLWKKKPETAAAVSTKSVDDSAVGTAADVEEVMKKYDRESNTRIWTGRPKQVVRFIMAAFSVYCLCMTLLFRGIAEIPLTLFLGFIIIIGYLNYPVRKHNVRENYLPWYDIVIMVVGSAPFFYYALNAEKILLTDYTVISKSPIMLAMAVVVGLLVLAVVLTGIAVSSMYSSRMVNLRLNHIGELATQVGYFTNVQVIENTRDIWGIKIPFTQSKYVFSYDGTIKAGVDFEKIDWKVNEMKKEILLKMPPVQIISNEINMDSLEVYDEKKNIFCPLKLDDMNQSLAEFKKESEDKAKANGLFESAKANAELLVTGFMSGAYDPNAYTFVFEWDA